MCKYSNLSEGLCILLKEKCPYLYFCTKTHSYKELRSKPDICKVTERFELPKGFYKVSYENLGNLYVEVDGYIKIIKNPYDYTPSYVKIARLKSGKWKIKQAMG